MDEALRTKLLGHVGLAALVTKLAWDERPTRGSFAAGKGAVVLTMVAPGRDYTHEGWDGLDEPLVQVDVWALDPSTARAVTIALTAAIEPEETVTITGGSAFVVGPSFLQAEDIGTDELGGEPLFRRRQDWIVLAKPVGA